MIKTSELGDDFVVTGWPSGKENDENRELVGSIVRLVSLQTFQEDHHLFFTKEGRHVVIPEKYVINKKLLLPGVTLRLIAPAEQGQPSFVCPICKKESFNVNDIAESYCGFCHKFFGD